ncbi:MAG: hypothetical protein GWP56_16365 [Gammaproteobacteria bacterium]|jgi:hypothetical protein|nr:hypothetical protein [Gammaproteobacteria bacterium]
MAKEIARLGIIFTSFLITTNAAAVTVADLLISEVMVNPGAVSDTRGEWFELYNPTTEEINLRNITIGDDGGDSHKIETDLLILPGHFLTLARNGDTTLNGGLSADYVYDDFTLSNSGDEILLHDGSLELLRLEYGNSFDTAGQSRELIATPMIEANYDLTLASLTYGLGNIGTPGASGSINLTPSAVPIPAAAWLFITGVLAIFKFIPTNPKVIPMRRTAAQAGISQTPRITSRPVTRCCAT